MSYDELMSAAMMLAIKCLRSWDENKSAFSTYYFHAAKDPHRHVIFNYRAVDGYGVTESLNVRKYGEEDDDELIDLLVEDGELDEHVARKMQTEDLHRAIAQLPCAEQMHAYDTLEGKVSWKNVEETAEIRRSTLEHLKRLLDTGH